jgi:cytoskeleton protein RodZ
MNSEWADQPEKQGNQGAPGAQLKAQREAMGLTVDQIADQLKLAPRQVMALEADDYASLPNMAVTRGFVRAYAKVVKLDAAPLVAKIEVNPIAGHETPPVRRERISATFSESRFPTLTERSSKPTGWVIGAAVAAVLVAAFGAYQSGLLSKLIPARGESAQPAASAPASAPLTIVTKPATDTPPLLQPNVPLVSVLPAVAPAAAGATAPVAGAVAPAGAGTGPVVAPAPAPAAATLPPPAAAPAAVAPAAAAGPSTLVVKVVEDSWVEIRRPGKASLISRLVKGGNTETFEINGPAVLIVGKPKNVQATLGGAPLSLPEVPGGTIARVNIK